MANIRERRDKNGKLISYEIRVFRGRDANGEQLKPFQTTFKVEPGWTEKGAKKRAEAFAVVFEKQCRDGLTSDDRRTVEQYFRDTIELKKERGLKDTTFSLYKSLSERLIFPYIGYLKIRDLSPRHLNDLYTALSSDGLNRNGGMLSAKTRLEVHRIIHSVLESAVREGIVPYNAADRVEPPKRNKPDPVFYQPEEVDRILKAAENEPEQWRMLILFLLASGCRRGEALGLHWEDVDFDRNRVFVRANLTYTKESGVYLDSPKTKNSVRYIELPAAVMKDLRYHKSCQTEQRFKAGLAYQSDDNGGFVFAQGDGKPLHPCSVTSYMTKFSKRYGLPHINPHGFRHTMASMLIYSGVDPVTVSHRLGHDEVSTTTDIYSHMIADADSRSAEIIGDALHIGRA